MLLLLLLLLLCSQPRSQGLSSGNEVGVFKAFGSVGTIGKQRGTSDERGLVPRWFPIVHTEREKAKVQEMVESRPRLFESRLALTQD